MTGPAYPIINRLRIPRGPHRLRDRRWPPVDPPVPDSQPLASQPEPAHENSNAILENAGATSPAANHLELRTKNTPDSAPVVIAGSAESINPEIDPSIWDETKPSVGSTNKTVEQQSSEKKTEASETPRIGLKHTQSTF